MTEHREISESQINRRKFLQGAAAGAVVAPAIVEAITRPQNARAEMELDTSVTERDPLVLGMEPSTVNTSDSFKEARGFDVTFNTQIQSEMEVQNRLDKAVLEMFNVMKTNENLLNNGELNSFIANGNIPEGIDTEEFSKQLQESDELPITTMYYPDGAQSTSEGEWGAFDAKKGLKLNFVEEEGLFVISENGATGNQIFGFTPRITEEGGLQLDIFDQFEMPPAGYPNAENAPDINYTKSASTRMQIMMLSYGKNDIYINSATEQSEKFFIPPYTINDTIASQMSNLPVGSGNYFDAGISNRSCLLDFKPIGK